MATSMEDFLLLIHVEEKEFDRGGKREGEGWSFTTR